MMKLLHSVVVPRVVLRALPRVGRLAGSLALSSAVLVAACSPTASPGTGGNGGTGARTGGSTGSTGTGGTTPAGTGGTTTSGSGGTTTPGGTGGTAGGSTGGSTGASGGSTGSGGTTGGGGSGGSSSGDAGGGDTAATDGAPQTGFRRQYTCPAGPLPAGMAGTSMTVCNNFQFRYNYKEGAAWIASENAFFFSNFVHMNPGGMAGGDIIKYTMGGDCEIWVRDVGTNGLAVHANGNLIGASHRFRAIVEWDVKTKQQKILANMSGTQMLDSPNDLVGHGNGTIYFTNPTYELGGRPQGVGPAVFRIDPMGAVHLIMRVGGQPNGIALSPDEKTLHVVGAGVWTVDANGVPTTRTGGGPGGDGINVDCNGRVQATGTNSAFGGPDGKTLFSVPGLGGGGPRLIQYNIPGLP
jgi:gluconolactonase